MPSWPKERRLLGTRVTRLEAPLKVAGRAKYAYDQNLPGMLQTAVLGSPHGRARITRLDLEAARRMPGVKAVWTGGGPGRELRHHGEMIAAIAAETLDQARDAVRKIDIAYEVLPAVVTEEDSMAPNAPQLVREGNVNVRNNEGRGDVPQGFAAAKAVFEGTFRCRVVTHCCLEPHGAVAQWDGDRITVWATTQGIHDVKDGIANVFKVSPANIEVICEHMGGGFGSKFGLEHEAVVAASLARDAGRPVKLMLERENEQTTAGCRPSAVATIKIAADESGRLTAFDATTYGTGGIGGGAGFGLPFMYRVPAFGRKHSDVRINAGSARAMRAPGHPESSFLMESAMEGLAVKLGLDPLDLRRRNLPADSLWQKQLTLGAERIGWPERLPTGSQTGRLRVGYGCAVTGWWGGGHDSNARVAIHNDGQVEVWCGTQDLGTGTRTALAVVAAETFGLQPHDVLIHVGRASYPPSGSSGGSSTIGGVAPAVRTVSETVLGQLFERLAPALDAAPADLEVAPGVVRVKGKPDQSLSWKDACARLGAQGLSAEGAKDKSLAGGGCNGAQFAKVEVDVETGIVRVRKMVALQDCGLIVNLLTAESQVYGGVVLGIGYALYEERVLDRDSGRMLNPNLEFYKLAGPGDMPEIEVIMQDLPERQVIGLGEPPTIPTASAIAGAVHNALGVLVPSLPLTPANVLAALGEV
ncbi:MAG: xanthine dehydrogenase family protein molybdopterin-binding subunit [Armatimonadetes bacterium]|nr:xanthine dehydrogenase family protein molybdopterin-binding subunit [Armatimonadota bacterium]